MPKIYCQKRKEKKTMAQIKLFDTWTYAKEIPEPFSKFMKELKIRKTTFEAGWLSQYNDGKQATLHPATLYAVLAVAKYICGNFPEQSEFKEGIMVF